MKFLTAEEDAILKRETSDYIENKIAPLFKEVGAEILVSGANIKRLAAKYIGQNRYVEVFYHFNDDCFVFELVQDGKLIFGKRAYGPASLIETSKSFARYLKDGWAA